MQAYGRSRDMKILEGIERFRYMTTPQIAELYFPTVAKQEHKIKKTNERMKRMYDRGYVQRFRFPSEPYIFTVRGNKFSNRIQHYLMITQCWITLNKIKPSGSVLTCEVEYKQGDVQTDLVVEYKNNFRQENKLYWLEVENESTGDIIEKIAGYEALAWSRKSDNLPAGQLVIVCKKSALVKKIEANSFDVPVKVIPYAEFEQEWSW